MVRSMSCLFHSQVAKLGHQWEGGKILDMLESVRRIRLVAEGGASRMLALTSKLASVACEFSTYMTDVCYEKLFAT